MTKISEVIQHLELHAPLSFQESYDNSGLIVGDTEWEVKGIIVCLDSLESIIEEAIKNGANLVVAHHPIIFSGLKSIVGQTYVERVVIKAIQHRIAIYAFHTNLDNVLHQGVNSKICEILGLINLEPLKRNPSPMNGQINELKGSGMLGTFTEGLDIQSFLKYVKEKLNTNTIRYTPNGPSIIKKIAVCGGSGAFLIDNAMNNSADAYITSDVKYHEFFDQNDKMYIIDVGHYESEQFTIQLIVDIISKKFTNFAVCPTKVNTNPIKYY